MDSSKALIVETKQKLYTGSVPTEVQAADLTDTLFCSEVQLESARIFAKGILGVPLDANIDDSQLLTAFEYAGEINYLERSGEERGDLELTAQEVTDKLVEIVGRFESRTTEGASEAESGAKEWKLVRRARRRLSDSLEAEAQTRESVLGVGDNSDLQDPNLLVRSTLQKELIDQTTIVLRGLIDSGLVDMEDELELSNLRRNIFNGLARDGALNLVMFVCAKPPSNFGSYSRRGIQGALIEKQIGTLKSVLSKINRAAPLKLTFLIGDDDDRYLDLLPGLPVARNRQANRNFREDLTSYLKDKLSLPGARDMRVLSLGDYEYEVNDDVAERFDQRIVRDECEAMSKLFNYDGFYSAFSRPENLALQKVVRKKVATYAAQGVLINENLSNPILIMNEQPPKTKVAMVNGSLDGKDRIPAIYPKF